MFSPPVGKRKRTTGSIPYYISTTVNKTSMIGENKEQDQNNLFSLLAGFKKDINQQVDECTDSDSISKTDTSMDDNTAKVCDNPPMPVPDIPASSHTHQLYFNVACSHKKI